jgi:hypothetical protein
MRTRALTSRWFFTAGLLLACLPGRPAWGQEFRAVPADPPEEPILPSPFELGRWAGATDGDRAAAARGRAVHLFHMPTGFLSDPVEAALDPDLAPPGEPAAAAEPDGADLPIQAAMYQDNPYFDFRRPGDPGGPGFYRIHTQLQVLGSETTGCTLGLQAVTPAGLENDGLADGPTVLVPNVALYHELFNGLEIQGFVGKNVRLRSGWEDHIKHSLHYGVALAHAVPGFDGGPLPHVDFFLEALGRYRMEGEARSGAPAVWELLPGLHWRVGDNWWLSGGVLMPLNTPRFEMGKWQLTCSWQF